VDQSASNASLHLDHCLSGGNPLCPDLMSAEERLAELAQILVTGLLRLRRKESERHVSPLEKNSLDFSPGRSVHATTRKRRKVAR
jgi:hypothetical protein